MRVFYRRISFEITELFFSYFRLEICGAEHEYMNIHSLLPINVPVSPLKAFASETNGGYFQQVNVYKKQKVFNTTIQPACCDLISIIGTQSYYR
jgi:hypothetical protein